MEIQDKLPASQVPHSISKPISTSPSLPTPKDTVSLSSKSKEESQSECSAPKGDFIIIPRKSVLRAFTSSEEAISAAKKTLENEKVNIKEELPIVKGFTAQLDSKQKEKLEKEGYIVYEDKFEKYIPDFPLESVTDTKALQRDILEEKPMLNNALPTVANEPASPSEYQDSIFNQYTGKGVGIAIIDTGIYPHPDFIDKGDRIKVFVDFVEGRPVPYDDGGHGTHVAGDAAGAGVLSKGLYRGPASEADIIMLKAMGETGGKTSDIIKAINWVVKHKDEYNIKVLNMSLGHPATNYEEDPVDIAVEEAVKAGITVVAAAGNSGPEPGTISAPADSPFVIAVGAIDDKNTPARDDDEVAPFSSRGPTPVGLTKPDVLAPGESIVAPLAPMSKMEVTAKRLTFQNKAFKWLLGLSDKELQAIPPEALKLYGLSNETVELIQSSPENARKVLTKLVNITSRMALVDEGKYGAFPGTSMASPIVAGVVADMYQANPSLTPMEVKQILMETAEPLDGVSPNEQGAGVINAKKAILKAKELLNKNNERSN